jgi:hypothetical protein
MICEVRRDVTPEVPWRERKATGESVFLESV